MRKILFVPIILVFVLNSSFVFAAKRDSSGFQNKTTNHNSSIAENDNLTQDIYSDVDSSNVNLSGRRPIIISLSAGYSHSFPTKGLDIFGSSPGFNVNITTRIPKVPLFFAADISGNYFNKDNFNADIYSTRLLFGLSHVFSSKMIGIEPFIGGGLVISSASIDTIFSYRTGAYEIKQAPYIGAGGTLVGGIRLFINRNFLLELSGRYDWSGVSLIEQTINPVGVDVSGFSLFFGVGLAY